MRSERNKIWKEAVRFHGHRCPGLAVGVRIALACRERMSLTRRAEDEELVAVTETDACGVDGIQSVLGCTAGKGNLWIMNRGKSVFTVFVRSTGEGLRYSWLNFYPNAATPESKIEYFLNGPAAELYAVEPARISLPPKAVLYPSACCSQCGERTAEPHLAIKNGRKLCRDCAGDTLILSRS